MTDRRTIEALVKQAYSARDKGEVDGLMEAFHPDGSFELAGATAILPVAGAVQGHPNVRASMAGFVAAFEFIEREILSFVVDGQRAAVHCRLKVRFIPKDAVVTTDVLDLFKFEDGKVAELVEFADTALIKDLISAAA
jgi:ketosteroid isomerase-like protein